MNIINYRDPAQIYSKLANDLWDAFEASLSSDNLAKIACLKPECQPNAELSKRQWMALVTVSSIINVKVTLGEFSISAVLDDIDFCNC